MTRSIYAVARVPALIRYGIAAIVAGFMVFAGVALAGAGHGWVAGGFGCFALAPICFVAWANAVGARPSRPRAVATAGLALVACIVVAVATSFEGFARFVHYWAEVGIGGILVAGFAYLNGLLVSAVAVHRAERLP